MVARWARQKSRHLQSTKIMCFRQLSCLAGSRLAYKNVQQEQAALNLYAKRAEFIDFVTAGVYLFGLRTFCALLDNHFLERKQAFGQLLHAPTGCDNGGLSAIG